MEIILYPAIVQGDEAPASIINGIRALESLSVDVMIVGRGGGSIEDLWAFNEEAVARAVFDCEVPVISAVGHETDTTITDFVADLRAPTPSAAAELAVYEADRVEEQLLGYKEKLNSLIRMRIERERMLLHTREARLKALSPEARLKEQRMRLLHIEERLERAIENRIERMRHKLALYAGRMDGASPLKKLGGGYAFVQDEEKKSIKSVESLQCGMEVSLHFIDGRAKAKVAEVIKKPK